MLGYLIGKNVIREVNNNGKLEKWQIMFIQWANPQPIEYLDIRRVGYNATYKCVVNKIYEEE